jgi:hypothetical protein
VRVPTELRALRWLALGKLCAIKINADVNATIGGARERLHYGPVRQDIGGHVDFTLGAPARSE